MNKNDKGDLMWKKKLVAFLHDPPHKPMNIKGHEDERKSFLTRLGLEEEDLKSLSRYCDFQAAAADRLIFPNAESSDLKVDWKENFFEFRHPLGGDILNPERFPSTSAVMEEALISALDGITVEEKDWRLKYIRVWRLWPERGAREKNPQFAYIVADTRIPDHTIWQHNALAAAFEALGDKTPAFLLFQIGPVQDFIKQARKLQDLWSGSYILSYLISQAIIAVAEELGPDNIIYPQVRGTPLIDLHWHNRGYIQSKLRASHENELFVPNLPNRFLALVPSGEKGREIAKAAEEAVRKTWEGIADSVKNLINDKVGKECKGWDEAWDNQVSKFPVIDWVIHEWTDVETAINNAKEKNAPPIEGGWENCPLYHAYKWATEVIPQGEREEYDAHHNSAFAWMLHYALTDWKFAARKNARAFDQWVSPGKGLKKGIPKDYLDGKNEVIGGENHSLFWEKMRNQFQYDFPGSQLYGAITIIKRLWAESYLKDKLGLNNSRPKFESVKDIADALEKADKLAKTDDRKGENIYYAVLTMDGDEMGKWVSGVNAPQLHHLLAEKARHYFEKNWEKREKSFGLPKFENVLRPLSPGYHAALSEALSNFSLYCAGVIVEKFNGQLIYSGGDDVLAILPAKTALDCAQALQIAFRGLHPDDPKYHASEEVKRVLKELFYYKNDYREHIDGFVVLNLKQEGVGKKEHLKPNYPLMVMGPRATISAGIAIGHVHDPMQDTIQAARDAEKMAKDLNRKENHKKGNFAISIIKRSGETVSFRANWESGVPSVWSELFFGKHNLSEGFAHKYASRVKDLVIIGGSAEGAKYVEKWADDKTNDDFLRQTVELELAYSLVRQGGFQRAKAEKLAKNWCEKLIADGKTGLTPRDYLHFWLCFAFLNRISKSKEDEK
ncbi:MAG: type III-B CRISPR-associated protein Cas10/Cmr2 [Verrucomicrobiia bacterium]|jgi:CRISPR-associated protein Cmr2